ncbi:MAG: PIN domain-containing protein [Acidobacteria bacterium]|nr:PIN domain-containing protein [Acidobacteriota bacterium]
MPVARSFVDTNVLVYTDDADSPSKRRRATALLAELGPDRGVVSTQVLQEYFTTVTARRGVDAALARQKVEAFSQMHLVVPGLDDILAAIDLHRLHRLSYWDALIVRSATHAGCAVLYTEDLQAGRRFGGLEIVNPFA